MVYKMADDQRKRKKLLSFKLNSEVIFFLNGSEILMTSKFNSKLIIFSHESKLATGSKFNAKVG